MLRLCRIDLFCWYVLFVNFPNNLKKWKQISEKMKASTALCGWWMMTLVLTKKQFVFDSQWWNQIEVHREMSQKLDPRKKCWIALTQDRGGSGWRVKVWTQNAQSAVSIWCSDIVQCPLDIVQWTVFKKGFYNFIVLQCFVFQSIHLIHKRTCESLNLPIARGENQVLNTECSKCWKFQFDAWTSVI